MLVFRDQLTTYYILSTYRIFRYLEFTTVVFIAVLPISTRYDFSIRLKSDTCLFPADEYKLKVYKIG